MSQQGVGGIMKDWGKVLFVLLLSCDHAAAAPVGSLCILWNCPPPSVSCSPTRGQKRILFSLVFCHCILSELLEGGNGGKGIMLSTGIL